MPDFMPTGWVCPKCGRVMAPNVNYCLFCATENIPSVNGPTCGTDAHQEVIEKGKPVERTGGMDMAKAIKAGH